MNVNPITPVSPLSNILKQTSTNATGNSDAFKNILNDLIDNVNEANKASNEDVIKMASGNADDLHNIMINTQKQEIATLTLVQVRNKILDAYNEIMRVTL